MAITVNTLVSTDSDRSIGAYSDQFIITASNTDFIADPDDATVQIAVRGISVTTAGNYTLLTVGNARAVVQHLLAGVIYPISVIRVNSTGAASTTGIVGHR